MEVTNYFLAHRQSQSQPEQQQHQHQHHQQQQPQRHHQQQHHQQQQQHQSNHVTETIDPRQSQHSIHECSDTEFRCPYLPHTVCIHYEKLCDGRDDCGDNSDEQKCESGSIEDCAAGEFACGNGQCISRDLKCDHKYDCEDGTDESTCDYFIASQKRRENERPRERENDNQIREPQQQQHPAITREEAERQRQIQEREQELKRREQEEARREAEERRREGVESRREGEERRREEEERRREDQRRKTEEEEQRRRHQEFTSNVVHSNAPPTIQFNQEYDDASCLDHEFMCHTGECIDKRRLCDTREDCLDGSDERDCHNGRHLDSAHPGSLPAAPPVIEDDWPELPDDSVEPYEQDPYIPPTEPPRAPVPPPRTAPPPPPAAPQQPAAPAQRQGTV
uniref:Uncharacterized protein n=1 Tax=Panagrolaimus davidi TaxID=227884 RepID=A0A914PDA0_9BILA